MDIRSFFQGKKEKGGGEGDKKKKESPKKVNNAPSKRKLEDSDDDFYSDSEIVKEPATKRGRKNTKKTKVSDEKSNLREAEKFLDNLEQKKKVPAKEEKGKPSKEEKGSTSAKRQSTSPSKQKVSPSPKTTKTPSDKVEPIDLSDEDLAEPKGSAVTVKETKRKRAEVLDTPEKAEKPKKKSPAKQANEVKATPMEIEDKASPKKAGVKGKTSPAKPAKQETTSDPSRSGGEAKEDHPKLERKGSSSYSYRDYQTRGGPPMKGQKEVPVGAPNCLHGKVFLVTGVLDSLERDEACDLIQQYGGQIAKSVVKKLTHLVAGREAGESKLEKSRKMGAAVIDEDGLFELIKSSKPQKLSPKQVKALKLPTPTTMHAPLPPAPAKAKAAQPPKEQQGAPQLWADKYKPQSTSELIGNPGPIASLAQWLRGWKPSAEPKAALLSGNPGIGKTSAALLVIKECGYEAAEFNASDARGKKAIQERVAHMTGNKSIGEFYKPQGQGTKKIALVMDEVDGMSSGDRGGMAELISLIKVTKIPVICICNDRSSDKVRSLANHCLDVRFRKPTVQQATSRIMEIARKEGFATQQVAIQKVLESVNVDIRQALNLLQLWRSTSNTLQYAEQMKNELAGSHKDIDQGPFDVIPQIFSRSKTLSEKIPLYFVDSGIVPLMVQENYASASGDIDRVAAAAESISDADLMDVYIHKYQHWELSNEFAVLSSIRPASLVDGNVGRVNFASWLGKTSSSGKRNRLLKEAKIHMSPVISADKTETRLQYLPLLKEVLFNPLVKGGVDDVLELMDKYNLTKEDWDGIMEIVCIADHDQVLKQIPTNVKSAFTRKYNAAHHLRTAPSKRSKQEAEVPENGEAEEVEPQEEEEEEDIKADKLIKVGKGTTKKPKKETKKKVVKKKK